MKTARQLRTELARLRREIRDESWQPLTADTVLPSEGYLVLYDSHTEDCHTWKLPLLGCSVADFSPDYTHYRVLRGPGDE